MRQKYKLEEYVNSLRPMIKELVNNLGYELLCILFSYENQNNCLRLKIKHPERPISLNDCELVSKQIEKELDLKDSIPFSYTLEVESPGINYSNPGKEFTNQFEISTLGITVKS